jgi:streptomycin 6-kinase
VDLQSIVSQMEDNARAIRALVAGCSDHQARWKPDATSWSILEVINHLLDEERKDFRARIDLVLHRGEETWFRIDPEGWVTERGYNQRDLEPSLEGFLAAREESLAWLGELGEVAWTVGVQAPFGWIRAGDILAAWVAHDVLHMRQLVELKWAYLVQAVEPYEVRYAGTW